MTAKNDKYCITVEEAAKRLEVSKRTVYNRLRDGKLDGKKLQAKHGLKWFINEEEFKDQAEIIHDVVEVDRAISVDQLQQAFQEALESHTKELVEQNKKLIENNQQLLEDNQKLKKQNEELKESVHQLEAQNQAIASQLEEIVGHLENEKNKSIIDKIKDLF